MSNLQTIRDDLIGKIMELQCSPELSRCYMDAVYLVSSAGTWFHGETTAALLYKLIEERVDELL